VGTLPVKPVEAMIPFIANAGLVRFVRNVGSYITALTRKSHKTLLTFPKVVIELNMGVNWIRPDDLKCRMRAVVDR